MAVSPASSRSVTPAGAADGCIQPVAVSNPGGGDTSKLISGPVLPGLPGLPQHGDSTNMFSDLTQAGTFVLRVQAAGPHGATGTQACSITWLNPRPRPADRRQRHRLTHALLTPS